MKPGQRVQARASRGAEKPYLMVVRAMPGLVVTIDALGQLALWSWGELVMAD